MAKLTKKELASTGSKIMAKAKQIRKENPKMKWTDCVKKAGKSYKK